MYFEWKLLRFSIKFIRGEAVYTASCRLAFFSSNLPQKIFLTKMYFVFLFEISFTFHPSVIVCA